MESRSTLRHPVDLAATVTVNDTAIVCSVRNVSLGGVFVHGPSLSIGTRVRLRFGGWMLTEIEVECTTRWNTSEGSGLRFDGLRAAQTYALATFIAKASAPSIPILR